MYLNQSIILALSNKNGDNMASQRKTQTIPRATCARILMNAGANRVSVPAAAEFSEVITKIALSIGEKAVKIAQHSGRKTVDDRDVKLAASK